MIAVELLEFIHQLIEDVGDAVDPDLKEKPLSDFLAAFLDSKDFLNSAEIVEHIHADIQMRHAIPMFVVIANKIQERE